MCIRDRLIPIPEPIIRIMLATNGIGKTIPNIMLTTVSMAIVKYLSFPWKANTAKIIEHTNLASHKPPAIKPTKERKIRWADNNDCISRFHSLEEGSLELPLEITEAKYIKYEKYKIKIIVDTKLKIERVKTDILIFSIFMFRFCMI